MANMQLKEIKYTAQLLNGRPAYLFVTGTGIYLKPHSKLTTLLDRTEGVMGAVGGLFLISLVAGVSQGRSVEGIGGLLPFIVPAAVGLVVMLAAKELINRRHRIRLESTILNMLALPFDVLHLTPGQLAAASWEFDEGSNEKVKHVKCQSLDDHLGFRLPAEGLGQLRTAIAQMQGESHVPSGLDETLVKAQELTCRPSDDIQRIIRNTQEAWRTRRLAVLSDHFEKLANSRTHEDFTKIFHGDWNAIEFCVQVYPPEEDEFLIWADDAQACLSCVLTNKYLYFFGLDQGVLAKKYATGKIPLQDIASCTLNEGLVLTKAQLTLRSGETIQLRDLISSNPIKYILRLCMIDEGTA